MKSSGYTINWHWNDVHTLHGRPTTCEIPFSSNPKSCAIGNRGTAHGVSPIPKHSLTVRTRTKVNYTNEVIEMGRSLGDNGALANRRALNFEWVHNIKRGPRASKNVR